MIAEGREPCVLTLKLVQAQAQAQQLQEGHDVTGLKHIEIGTFEVESWYSAPYPEVGVGNKKKIRERRKHGL